MQRALKKQLKEDRITEANKRAKEYDAQAEREEELREISRRMRRREDTKRWRSPERGETRY